MRPQRATKSLTDPAAPTALVVRAGELAVFILADRHFFRTMKHGALVMLMHRKRRSRRRHGSRTRNCLAEQHTLIRKCLFEQLEDRRMLAALPTITIDDVQQMEGDSGTTDCVFTVTRSGKTNGSSTISYSTAPGSATPDDDFTPTSGTLSFAAKETSQTIVVPVIGDTTAEDDETFYVNLTIINNGKFGDGRGVGTIVSDDTGPSLPELAIDDVQLVEGDNGTSTMEFTVTRTGDLSLSSTVDYATADNTATIADNDYVTTSGRLVFDTDEDSKTILVPVTGDITVEDEETFFVDLTIINNGQFGISRGVGTILNDDTDPVLPDVAINDVQLVEGDSGTTTVVFTVTRTGDLSGPSTVDYTTTDGTATTNNNDYLATSGTLSFAANEEDPKTIVVKVVGDTFSEGDEVFYVDLSAPDNAVITVPRGTGLIVGDDGGLAPPPGLVSWWTADGTANDLMQRNDAELVDGTTYASGMVGQAFDFDGVNDRVQLPDSESLKLTESLSIEGWIRADSLPVQQGEILFRGDDRGGLDPYSLSLQSSGSLRFEVASLNGAASVWAPLTLDRFTHVAGTLDDASGEMRIYLDGVLISQITTTQRPFGDLDPASNPGIGIGNHGGDPDTPHNFPFDGLIDELSVYNRALTSEEVQRIYHTGTQGKVKMTVAKTSPDIGSVSTASPTEFIVDFTFPVDSDVPVNAADIKVNGISADSVVFDNDMDTATFSFVSNPVTNEGLQTIELSGRCGKTRQ